MPARDKVPVRAALIAAAVLGLSAAAPAAAHGYASSAYDGLGAWIDI